MNEELILDETAWNHIFHSLEDIVTIQDKNYTVLKANLAAYKSLGHSNKELIGRKCYELFTGLQSVCENCPLEATLKDHEKHKATIRHNNLDKIFQVTSSIFSPERNGPEYLLHIARDITDHSIADKQRQESEVKFEQAFDSSPDSLIIAVFDDGVIIETNSGFSNFSGYPQESILGKSLFDMHFWENPSDRELFFREMRTSGSCENLEVIFSTAGDTLKTGLLSGRVFLLNNIQHAILTIRDITELKQIEKESARQKMLFESMFDAIPDGIVITDKQRNIVMANRAMEKTFGLSPAELIGQNTSILHGDSEGYELAGKQVYNETARSDGDHYITRYRTKNGDEFPGETMAVKLYDQSSTWVGNLGIMRNVAERVKKELELERLEAAIEQTREAIIVTDPQGNIQYVNPAFEEISGYSRKEVLGKNPRILKSGRHNKDFYTDLWTKVTRGETFRGQIVNSKKDGTLFTEEATISPVIGSNNRIISFVAVKRDITDRLTLEAQFQQAQKMEAVGRLTGGVAHDFNNILGIIIGYAEMALSDIDGSHPLHDALSKILDAGLRSAGIVRQLLAFSRKQTIAPKVFEINTAVEEMLKMIHRLIGENISVSWHPAPRPLQIKMDPSQLDQILANLCINARDAIDGIGKLIIETSIFNMDKDYCKNHIGFHPGEYVTLTVSDDGHGIKKKDQDKVFEPFFTTKELGQGTGLGLSMVYGIIKQNNGFINLYSEPGQGTTIKLYIPIILDNPNKKRTESEPKAIVSNNEIILVVEDEPPLLSITQAMLVKLGFTVLTAQTPQEAITIAQQKDIKIDLLLTDIILPEMNGKELSHCLKSIHPHLKILFMSGYTANAIAKGGILEKGVFFIQKPFSQNSLSAILKEVLYQ